MSALTSALDSYSPSMGALNAGRQRDAAERVDAIRQGRNAQDPEKLESKVREVAEEFVSVFMNQVMKSMRATVNENPAMHGDNGEKFFQEMLDTEQSKTLAQGSGYGLTDLIYESMIASYRVAPAQAQQADADAMNHGQSGEAWDTADDIAVKEIA